MRVLGALAISVLAAAPVTEIAADRAYLAPAQLAPLSRQPAPEYITAAFRNYPLVAFSEPGHGVSGTKEFFASLIRHPGFAGRVTDIVIECGNARYQGLADRYFAGEAVPREALSQIWENTTIVSGVWLLPMYEEILADIRAFNLTLPEARRIRVLLGDPPIDWSLVQGPADEDMNDWRDAHFAWVVDQEVMKKKGRKALLWIGGGHTGRRVVMPDSLIHLLDRRFPNRTLVVHALARDQVSPSVKARLESWPSVFVAHVRNTWLGQLDAHAVGAGLSRGVVQDDVDALLFWDSSWSSTAAPEVRAGAIEIAHELRRRQRLAETTLPFRGAKIRFDANSASLAPTSEAPLNAVLAELQLDTRLTLLVKAFADAREPDGERLSRDRAERVVTWLTGRGIDPSRLIARGCGSGRALWVGDTQEERAANRRAELVRNSELEGCAPPSSFAFGR
jgi:outer membrane protein OmpA-like peptidoglycan-associated protein